MNALIVHWTKLFWIDVILYKNKTSQGTSITFFSFEVYQIPHMGKYFHVDHARSTCITAYPNMVTKPQRYAKSRDLQEKNESKNEGLLFYVKNIATFSWVLCKEFNGKTQENLRTVCNLFDHWNMALSSDFRHIKALLATRSVFHLFWRWQPVARALFQHEMLLC